MKSNNGGRLRDIFFHKRSFCRGPETPRGAVCVCYCPPVARKERFCRPINGRRVQLKLAGFFQVSVPQRRSTEGPVQYSSVRVTLTFGGGSATRAAPLQTEPTRTLQWKCAVSVPLPLAWKDQQEVPPPATGNTRTFML